MPVAVIERTYQQQVMLDPEFAPEIEQFLDVAADILATAAQLPGEGKAVDEQAENVLPLLVAPLKVAPLAA